LTRRGGVIMSRRRSAWGLGLGVVLLALQVGVVAAGSLKGTVTPSKGGTTEPVTEYFQGFWPRQALSVRATPYDPRPSIVVELKNNGRKQKNFTTIGSDVMKNVLIPRGGTLNAKFPTVGVFPIVVAGSPHMRAIVVVTQAKLFTRLDAAGNFKFDNLPDGSKYTLKLFYRDGWLARPPVDIEIKGSTEAPALNLDSDLETDAAAAPAPAAPAPAAPGTPAPAEGAK